MHKESVSKQGRKNCKRRGQIEMVDEDKVIDEDRLSYWMMQLVLTKIKLVPTLTKVSSDFEKVSTDKPTVSTDGSKVSTDEQIEGADDQVEGTEEKNEEGTEDLTRKNIANSKASQTSTQTPTYMIFGDDETIATLLLNMSKAKAVSKEKEKGNSKQLECDEELARKVQKEWEAKEERNRLAEEEATNDSSQGMFLLQQKIRGIRNRPPTKNQLRNQMMTYLKHVGNFKHSELKSKKFEDIQAMYEKIKRSDEDFIAIGSVEDESLIKKMKKKDSSKGEEIKQESKEEVKEEDKDEENTRKRKHGTRKKMKSRKRRFKQDTSQDDPSDIEKGK
ncbi:hypothetical protein Tco_0790302 [Tanacetum coccineum]